jgi:hypothetical chaperone protein
MPAPQTAPACGIDFGTSNSTVGLADATGARLIAVEAGHSTIPTAVFLDTETAEASFGRAAITAYTGGEDGRLMRGLKSTLGSPLIRETTRLGSRLISFREVLARFMAHLRARLDAETGAPLTSVVLGRPVHFVDDDPQGDAAAQSVLEDIARDLGFRDIAFQFEPIAAALHYESSVMAEELVLVADIGGGTSDFSILRVSPTRARHPDRAEDILANHGIRVGGTDLDRLLSLAEVMPHLGFGSPVRQGKSLMPRHYYIDLATWVRINMVYTARTLTELRQIAREADAPDRITRLIRVIETRRGHALAMLVEEAKIALTEAEATRLSLTAVCGGPNPVIRRDRFEEAIAAPLDRIGTALTATLAQAGLAPAQIGTVFLTGGSAHLPALHRLAGQLFPGTRIATGDMLGSVGTGLALDARRRFG